MGPAAHHISHRLVPFIPYLPNRPDLQVQVETKTRSTMSQVYSTEPQTAGRVIFETTHGPLEIQLWCRECPATTKYFLQLCLDGFYENVLFHRIVPKFLIQTGALRYNPTSRRAIQPAPVTSLDTQIKDFHKYRQKVQADQAMDRRPYELNTRIRFNHRGQLAMALPVNCEEMGEDEMALMQPQFFITLDEASELDGKHVCFGTVTGPTVFNALRIGNTDVEEGSHQPTILSEGPRIESVKIMENPIHSDIVPSSGVLPWKSTSGDDGNDDPKQKKKKRKAIKNINVLSFGDELEQDLESGTGIQSSHDVIATKKFSKKVDKRLEDVIQSHDDHESIKDEKIQKQNTANGNNDSKKNNQKIPLSLKVPIPLSKEDDSPKPSIVYQASSERRNQENPIVPDQVVESISHKEKPPKVSLVEARRAKYAKATAKDKRKREEDTMAKFLAFQSKVTTKKVKQDDSKTNEDDGIAARMARRKEKGSDEEENDNSHLNNAVVYRGQVLENDDDVAADWMNTRFRCKKHQDLDAKLGGDGRDAMEDYEVVDPKERPTNSKKGHGKQHHKKRDSSHIRKHP